MGREDLGVGQAVDVKRLGQDDGGGHQRSGQSSAAGLVDPGHQLESFGVKLPLVMVDGPGLHDRAGSRPAALPLPLPRGLLLHLRADPSSVRTAVLTDGRPYDPRNHPTREGGQMMTNARPMTLSYGMAPSPYLESREFSRLSPITNNVSGLIV